MTPEQAAQRIAEAINKVDLWQSFTEEERQAWVKAVEPVLADLLADVTPAFIRHDDGRIEQFDLEDYLEPRLGEQGA